MKIFFSTAIQDNGWLESVGNSCLKPVRGVMQCIKGNSWNIRQFNIDANKKIEEIPATNTSENLAYRIGKYILSFLFFIPGLIVGSLLKGSAQLDSSVAEKNKSLAEYLEKNKPKSIDRDVSEAFKGINIDSLPEIPSKDLNNLQVKDMGEHAIARMTGKSPYGEVKVILVRYIKRMNPEDKDPLNDKIIFHQDKSAYESILVVFTENAHLSDINHPILSPYLQDKVEIDWLKKLLAGEPCGKMASEGPILRKEGPKQTAQGKPTIELWHSDFD